MVYLRTEPGVGLNILRGIGLEDGLILKIPKCDWSSLLWRSSAVFGGRGGDGWISLCVYNRLVDSSLCRCSCKSFRLQEPFLPSTSLLAVTLSSPSSNLKLNTGTLVAQDWLGLLFFKYIISGTMLLLLANKVALNRRGGIPAIVL